MGIIDFNILQFSQTRHSDFLNAIDPKRIPLILDTTLPAFIIQYEINKI